MTTKNSVCPPSGRGFIALVASLIISAMLMAVLLSGSLPVFQYNQSVDLKIKSVKEWIKSEEIKDETDFHALI